MKVISFNVNSVRMRLHQLEAVIASHSPDFIGLQETKVTDEEFPEEAINAMGYNVVFQGQKTHYGVALLAKQSFKEIHKGFPNDLPEAQKRFIGGVFDSPFGGSITLFNGYFPQGESRDHPVKFPNKKQFYRDLIDLLKNSYSPDQQIIVMGDMNISPEDIDIGIGESNRKRWLQTGKCSFLPEEREWLDELKSWGLFDAHRHIYPDQADQYSWFDYRSRGFEQDPKRGLRIDLVLATENLIKRCKGAGIDYAIRGMDKPSDHCPVWAEFS